MGNKSGSERNLTLQAPVESPSGDRLMELLKLHNSNRIDYNVRKWETVKFFQTIVSALIGATVAALLAVFATSRPVHFDVLMRVCLSALPAGAAVASFLAILSIRRESRLLFQEELQAFKLAKLLGFDVKIPSDRRWLVADRYLLPRKWREPSYGTGKPTPEHVEDWLDARTRSHGFIGIFGFLFLFKMAASAVLLASCFLLKFTLPTN